VTYKCTMYNRTIIMMTFDYSAKLLITSTNACMNFTEKSNNIHVKLITYVTYLGLEALKLR